MDVPEPIHVQDLVGCDYELALMTMRAEAAFGDETGERFGNELELLRLALGVTEEAVPIDADVGELGLGHNTLHVI